MTGITSEMQSLLRFVCEALEQRTINYMLSGSIALYTRQEMDCANGIERL